MSHLSEIVQFVPHGEHQTQECRNDGGVRHPFHWLEPRQWINRASYKCTDFDMEMRFAYLRYPLLYAIDCYVA